MENGVIQWLECQLFKWYNHVNLWFYFPQGTQTQQKILHFILVCDPFKYQFDVCLCVCVCVQEGLSPSNIWKKNKRKKVTNKK